MWFGFDVMGELGFGRWFDTLNAAETSPEVHLVELGVRCSKQFHSNLWSLLMPISSDRTQH